MEKTFFKLICICLSVLIFIPGCVRGNGESLVNGGSYILEKELGITIWYTQGNDFIRGKTIENNLLSQWIYGQTKVKIENIYGNDGGQWDSKLYRLIAGESLPHLIVCSSGQGVSHFTKLAEENQIWEITEEMLAKYAPNILKRIPRDMLESFKVNGKLYGIPTQFSSDEVTQPEMTPEELELISNFCVSPLSDKTINLWIRDDISKALYPQSKSWQEICELIENRQEPIGDELFDIPIYTKEDYIDMMYSIKNMNLTSNEKPVYAYGYEGGDNWIGLNYLGGEMLGYLTHNYTSSWDPDNERIRIPLLEPCIREAARIQNQLVIDDVIEGESLVHTNEVFKKKVFDGRYAIISISSAGGAQNVNARLETMGMPYRYRPLLTHIENRPEYRAGKQPESWYTAVGFLKTLDESELIQMLNWLNVTFSDEFEEMYFWGPKDAGL